MAPTAKTHLAPRSDNAKAEKPCCRLLQVWFLTVAAGPISPLLFSTITGAFASYLLSADVADIGTIAKMGFLGINLPTYISFYRRNFIRTQLIRSNRAIKGMMSDFLQAWEISQYVPVRYCLVMETCDSTYFSTYGSKRYVLISLGSNFWSLFFPSPGYPVWLLQNSNPQKM